MAKGEPILLVATMSHHFTDADGTPHAARRGETIVWSDHPAARANPDYWKPVSPTYEVARIEQATAAPGEKRGG